MRVIVIGNGIAGLSTAYYAAKKGYDVVMVSPEASERSQSIMAAGGINAALNTMGEADCVDFHISDTLKNAKGVESEEAIRNLCTSAPEIVMNLKTMGVMFKCDDKDNIMLRSFGGQSKKRTAYAGTSTGKQIVTGFVRSIRKSQKEGRIIQMLNHRFISVLVFEGECYGALLLNEQENTIVAEYADAVVIASGGQNGLFGKTTGSTLCDGYAAARLFADGVTLRNLEFVQYHPTTIETPGKRILISEAVRGEGGRLFYINDDGSRCYFMEEKYGKNGNLMPRDVVSSEIYETHRQVFLDMSFLDKKTIDESLGEVKELCDFYLDIDVSKEPIPVAPSVHFFMGGIAVDINHKTNITGLFAVGECASIYHGANRLGGNSLLAAVYGGKVVADNICGGAVLPEFAKERFNELICREQSVLNTHKQSESKFSAVFILREIEKIMNKRLGIVRLEADMKEGLYELDFYSDAVEKLSFDGSLSVYEQYILPYQIKLAKAIMLSAIYRKESRGAHIRTDYTESNTDFAKPTYAWMENGEIFIGGERK